MIPIIIFSLSNSNIHLVCFALQLRNPLTLWGGNDAIRGIKMSTTLTATKTSKTQWLRLAKQQLYQVHFFAGTAPPRREIAKFHPHIDKVKNRRQLSLLFSLSNLNIFITNSTPGGLVLIWLRPRPHLFFFSVFDKKYAYSRSVFEPFSPILTFSKPAPFPVSAG